MHTVFRELNVCAWRIRKKPLPFLRLLLSFAFFFLLPIWLLKCSSFFGLQRLFFFLLHGKCSSFSKSLILPPLPPPLPKKIRTWKYLSFVFLNKSYLFTEWFWNSHSPINQSVSQLISQSVNQIVFIKHLQRCTGCFPEQIINKVIPIKRSNWNMLLQLCSYKTRKNFKLVKNN